MREFKTLHFSALKGEVPDRRLVSEAHVVVIDGVIFKDRDGIPKGRPGDAVLLKDEEKFIGAFSSVVRASHS